MDASKPFSILACDVFQEELCSLSAGRESFRSLDFLEMGLHDQPSILRQNVQNKIAEIEQAHPDLRSIVLAYGRCGNGLVGVRAGRCVLVLPQAHDCISILLGGSRQHDAVLKENPGTYFYSPGWVRGKRVPGPDREAHLREQYAERYPDDEDMVDDILEADLETFQHHNCAAYVSIVNNEAAENYCRQCAKHLGWSHRTLEGDPSFLSALLEGAWTDDRFLIVPPGATVGADSDGRLIAEV